MPHSGFYQRRGKRLLDLALAIPLSIVLLPVMLCVAVLVRMLLGSPVLFRQSRPGHRARPFTMLKFRTMMDTRDSDGRLLPDEQRLPAFGRLLRSTSLDELPELWHVLRGEMSLVGPRPLLMSYLDRYSPVESRRHDVRPGLTGWAQINGRNSIGWDTRLALDVWYVENVSLSLDLRILARTIGAVLRRSGVSRPGHATVPPLRPWLERSESPPANHHADGVVVIGAGGHAKVVVATLRAAGHDVAEILDDDPVQWGRTLLGIPVTGPVRTLERRGRCRAVIAIGLNTARRRIADQWPQDWVTVVHPAACVHESVTLGPGTVVFAGAVIQPDVRIGAHAIINTGSTVDHDATLEDFVHLAPGVRLAGQVFVGTETLVGIGSCAIPGVSIGAGTVVGAGSVVVRDIPDDVVAMGAPARVMRDLQAVSRAA